MGLKYKFSLYSQWRDKAILVYLCAAFSFPITSTSYSQEKTKPPPLPNEATMDVLIRTTILTLSNANFTGNYSVLRDIGAPAFQLSNSPAKLAMSFTELRGRKVDLSPIILFRPQLTKKPEIMNNGLLRLTGFIPTKPEQVNFDFAYQLVANRWRLFGISVNLSPAAQVSNEQSKVKPSSTQGKKSEPIKKQAGKTGDKQKSADVKKKIVGSGSSVQTTKKNKKSDSNKKSAAKSSSSSRSNSSGGKSAVKKTDTDKKSGADTKSAKVSKGRKADTKDKNKSVTLNSTEPSQKKKTNSGGKSWQQQMLEKLSN